ncbi:hypothetical protein H0H93_014957 [Arthromyces matolae]|nr:hypothetical protein H0H93_014957 [Arthromyces matolae]
MRRPSPDKVEEWVAMLERFAKKKKKKFYTKRQWQQLAGWSNWAFNTFPLIAPCLSNIYARLSETPDNPDHRIWASAPMQEDLEWGVRMIRSSEPIRLLESTAWDEYDADMVIETDACLQGLAIWIPHLRHALYCRLPPDVPNELIFYLEALTVTCAFLFATDNASTPQKIFIFCDNTNTVNIFNSFHALPLYNPLLKLVAERMIVGKHKLKVRHIQGEENTVADLISRANFAEAERLFPSILIEHFLPPRDLLGAVTK